MSDIVERLRENAKIAWGYPGMLPWPEHGSPLPNEAADTIEALRAENAELKDALLAEIKANVEFTRKQADEIARLREALKPFAEAADIYNLNDFSPSIDEEYTSFQIGLCRAAQAAMGESDE